MTALRAAENATRERVASSPRPDTSVPKVKPLLCRSLSLSVALSRSPARSLAAIRLPINILQAQSPGEQRLISGAGPK